MKYTPTPEWNIREIILGGIEQAVLVDGEGNDIGIITSRDKTRHIVKCCNLFSALHKFAKLTKIVLDNIIFNGEELTQQQELLYMEVEQLLEKCEE